MSTRIEQATNRLTEFEETKDADQLQSAVAAMEGVDLSTFGRSSERMEIRQQALRTWLKILATIDSKLNPNFDPEDVPEANIMPPRSGGVRFPAGVDPKAIKDPAARAEYEAALKKNHDKAELYRLQTKLRRLDPRASSDVERFLKLYYTSTEADQREFDQLLDREALSASRRRKLKTLFHKE